jgi:hypothetical protein
MKASYFLFRSRSLSTSESAHPFPKTGGPLIYQQSAGAALASGQIFCASTALSRSQIALEKKFLVQPQPRGIC